MRLTAGPVALFLAVLAGWMAQADTISTVPEAVQRYARQLQAVRKSAGPVSLEPLFEQGIAAGAAVQPQLEQFAAATYRQVQELMAGFFVGREEVVVAEPDAGFFLKLAENGTATDRAFFGLLKKTYPESYWPAYKQQRTDYGGCIDFEGHFLTELYAEWMSFQKAYPGQYRRAAQKELTGIEEAVSGTCACGGEEDVARELAAFQKAFPNAPIAGQVAAVRAALASHTSPMRFHCQPQ